MQHPIEVQEGILKSLLKKAQNTEQGRKFEYRSIKSLAEYRERLPIQTYEDVFPQIDRMMRGEPNILWPGVVSWFSKSSGTTNAKSKFIPVTKDALDDCHYKGGKDLISLYFHNNPASRMFNGKGLAIGGSYKANERFPNSYYGDVSAVIMANLPRWAGYATTPHPKISLLGEWEEKLERMSHATITENVTNISGVPTWTIVLLEKILAKTGKKNMLEVWPNFEVFFHGAVAFHPYREIFQRLFPKPDMHYMETYNASEGFFAMKDSLERDDMLLMLDYGVYYEFLPTTLLEEENPKTLSLEEVVLNINYAMIISTNGGLWRYQIGDTIKFTSLKPYRIKISGRTKHYINAFGEELIIENAEVAMSFACKETQAEMVNFTAAPLYMVDKTKGAHEWIVEFSKCPNNIQNFAHHLDAKLQSLNSDYEAKRYKNYILQLPIIHVAPEGTFYEWMKQRKKLGAQNKVPRLANDRGYLEDILSNFLSK